MAPPLAVWAIVGAAVKVALDWFKKGARPDLIAKHADKVMKHAEKIAKAAKKVS